ncbi:hypothetical protein FA15DRAFT_150190 [Coprinopsis marcescibilis]|uniref:Uncharacterized protein n=1 Tax=Coprinopsis marcescibilis TaxID=230819 RepID=A0A5C3KIZ8_COPMA|nr:hypothetical protein FA15DRAFT_150190 [Coprinopsis marcescibilis]
MYVAVQCTSPSALSSFLPSIVRGSLSFGALRYRGISSRALWYFLAYFFILRFGEGGTVTEGRRKSGSGVETEAEVEVETVVQVKARVRWNSKRACQSNGHREHDHKAEVGVEVGGSHLARDEGRPKRANESVSARTDTTILPPTIRKTLPSRHPHIKLPVSLRIYSIYLSIDIYLPLLPPTLLYPLIRSGFLSFCFPSAFRFPLPSFPKIALRIYLPFHCHPSLFLLDLVGNLYFGLFARGFKAYFQFSMFRCRLFFYLVSILV